MVPSYGYELTCRSPYNKKSDKNVMCSPTLAFAFTNGYEGYSAFVEVWRV